MKKIFYLLLAVILLMTINGSVVVAAGNPIPQGWYVIEEDGDHALITEDGSLLECNSKVTNVVTLETETELLPYIDLVWNDIQGSYMVDGYIATSNVIVNYITGEVYEVSGNVLEISGDYALLCDDNAYEVYNCLNETAIPIFGSCFKLYPNGFAIVDDTIVNCNTGEIVFENGNAIWQLDGDYALTKATDYEIFNFMTGEMVMQTSSYIHLIYNGYAMVENTDNNFSLINYKGEKILDGVTRPLGGDYWAVEDEKGVRIFNTKKRKFVSKYYDSIREHNGHVDIFKNGLQGLYSLKTESVIIRPRRVKMIQKGEYHTCGIDVFSHLAIVHDSGVEIF